MAKNKENQALRKDVEKMKDHMAEMMKVLQVPKKRNADEATSEGNTEDQTNRPPPHLHNSGIPYPMYPTRANIQSFQWLLNGLPLGYTPPQMEAISEESPSRIVVQNKAVTMGQNANTGTQQDQDPNLGFTQQGLPISYTLALVVDPQAPGSNFRNPSHSHIPNMNSAVVLMTHPYYGMRGFPHGYLT